MRNWLVGVAVIAAVGMTTDAASAAKWAKPRPVRGDTTLGPEKPLVGVDGKGGAVVAWTEKPTRDNRGIPEEGRVRIASRDPGRRFGTPLRMPETGAKLLDVAVGPDGTAAVLYTVIEPGCAILCKQPLRVVLRDAGGKFRKPVTVVAEAFAGQVEVDGKGVVTVAWMTPVVGAPRTAVAERKPRRSFGRPTLLPGPGGYEAPVLRINDRGDAAATWTYGGGPQNIYGTYRKAGGKWEKPVLVGGAFGAQAAIAENGDAALMWAVNSKGYASLHSGRKKFGAGTELPVPIGGGDIAMDDDGNVLATYGRQSCQFNCDLNQPITITNFAVTLSLKTGKWREQQLTGAGEVVDFAFDGRGTAFALFTVWAQPGQPGGTSVASARRGRAFGGKQTLTTAAAWDGAIDVNDDGDAVAAWVQGAPGGSVVAAIRE